MQKIRLTDIQPVVRIPVEEVPFGQVTKPVKIGEKWFIFKFDNIREIPYGAPADYAGDVPEAQDDNTKVES